MTDEHRLGLALLIMRLTIAAFFAVWALGKILAPAMAVQVFSFYYASDVSALLAQLAGGLQLAVILAFAAGLWRTWTIGALLAMHTVSVLATWPQLLDPWQPPNGLFWAGVPVLAALLALFLLRRRDTLLSVRRA